MGFGHFNPGCNCCCPIDWSFTDQGFIDGGQNGALREYDNPADVAASPWTILDQCLGLRIEFEDSDDSPNWPPGSGPGCAEHNPYRQIATASGTIRLSSDKIMTINWSGKGEQEDANFELMSLVIDGTNTFSAHAPGGDLNCAAMADVVSSPAPPQQIALTSGAHTIQVTADTSDPLYHVDAFYQFQFSFSDLP